MKLTGLIAAGVAAILMTSACSGSSEGEGNEAASEEAAAPSGSASAEDVAEEARGDVDCPAKASSPRAAAAPVDDVVGVRPGMSWDEAANFVMCDNPLLVVAETKSRDFSINTYGAQIRQGFEAKFAEARVEKSGQEILKEMQEENMRRMSNAYTPPLQPGQIRYFVGTMGLPGQERVVSVAREEYFPAEKLPTAASIESALIAKYGPPATRAEAGPKLIVLGWGYDPIGRRVTETSPLFRQCTNMGASPDSSTSLSPDCGVTVAATIALSDQNPGLARSLAVASKNGAEGYARLKNTEQALMQSDAARKAEELKKASADAAQPKL